MTRMLLISVLTLSLAGCSTLFGESEGTTDTSLTIMGSKQFEDDPRLGDSAIFLIAIDGKLAGSGRNGWDDPIALTPGWHSIRYGIAGNADYLGIGDVQAKLEDKKSYVLRSDKPVPLPAGGFSAACWIDDNSGIAVSNKVAVQIVETGLTTAAAISVGP